MIHDVVGLITAPDVTELVSFLQGKDIDAYFAIHPNQLSSPSFLPPDEWSHWWNWAGTWGVDVDEEAWLLLWRYYAAPAERREEEAFQTIPESLRLWIDIARSLQIHRAPIPDERIWQQGSISGMSPKKEHEVKRMTAYISKLLASLSKLGSAHIQQVVDIGAGQAYLSRSLRDRLHLDVLALDRNDVQYRGAMKKEKMRGYVVSKKQASQSLLEPNSPLHLGSLAYKTVTITSESLLGATEEWIERNFHAEPKTDAATEQSTPKPVLLVALHACGSLAVDIFRALVEQWRCSDIAPSLWTPKAAVIVGCCYNMLRAEDRVLQCHASNGFTLSTNHLQLAAQIPSQWGPAPNKLAGARLAVRKVAWRALLEGLLLQTTVPSQSDGRGRRRLGRLSDTAYIDWDTFLAVAQQKLGIGTDGLITMVQDRILESRISIFHVMRCILGPVVESLILLDRQEWLKNELHNTGLEVELVNLFDQNTGSGRNVAIVVKPSLNQRDDEISLLGKADRYAP